MRKALTWLAGAVGLAALLRHLARRHASAAVSVPVPPVEADPADELRRKLADQQLGEESAGTEETEVADDADSAALEDRRARVHAQAQAAIDSMRDVGGEDTEGDSGA